MALCRCGFSDSRPFCDDAHSKKGFTGDKNPERIPDKNVEYIGKDITIVDNRGICSHDGACITELPLVFTAGRHPWIDADQADVKTIIEVIEMCPSGALSYMQDGKRIQDHENKKPGISIIWGGPYEVYGSVVLKDPDGNKPECKEHYALCRCGESQNKSFCDGQHFTQIFMEDDL